MTQLTREENGTTWYLDTDGCWIDERWVCHHCMDERVAQRKPVRCADEQFSLGIYAGKYCEECWEKSGYRKEGASGFDPMDAGESYEPID